MKLYSNIIGKSGKPLFILHGFLGMGDNWKTLAKRFSEKGFQVHLIDQRNHGRSPHTNDFSYELMAEDLKEYCQQHDINQASVIGHSMGGKTAMRFATTYPEYVKDLIIVDIAPKYYRPHHQTILEGLTKLEQTELTSRGQADELLSAYIEDWSTRQFLLKNLYWKEKGKLALRMNLSVLKEKIEAVGEAIEENKTYSGKTLFIKGENSNYIKETDREQIKVHFPKSSFLMIKDAGHWVHAEKADEFYEAVLSFLTH